MAIREYVNDVTSADEQSENDHLTSSSPQLCEAF